MYFAFTISDNNENVGLNVKMIKKLGFIIYQDTCIFIFMLIDSLIN